MQSTQDINKVAPLIVEIEQFPVTDRFVESDQRSYQVQSEFSCNQEIQWRSFWLHSISSFSRQELYFLNEHMPPPISYQVNFWTV